VADPRSGASDESEAGAARERARMSIAERAARRDRLVGGRDRYSSLVRVLRAGREIPLRPRKRSRLAFFEDLDWHPIGTRLVVLVAVVAIIVTGTKLGGDWLRERTVSTWNGPDASVTSGQRLDACPGASVPAAVETYPNWLRYGGQLYLRTDDVRPGLVDGISYINSGYGLDHLLLVLLENTPAGRARQEVMLWSDGAMAGYVYRVAPGC
jgi:hypothetical protein